MDPISEPASERLVLDLLPLRNSFRASRGEVARSRLRIEHDTMRALRRHAANDGITLAEPSIRGHWVYEVHAEGYRTPQVVQEEAGELLSEAITAECYGRRAEGRELRERAQRVFDAFRSRVEEAYAARRPMVYDAARRIEAWKR